MKTMRRFFSMGPKFWLCLMITFSSFSSVQPTHCPLLRSSTNDTGVLHVNRTMLIATDSAIHCQWLIVGSLYQRIVVEFDYVFIPVAVEEYLQQGCRRGSVNLWTPGLENEKIQICGDRRHMRVGGVGQTLMVELRINDIQLDLDFLLRYRLIQLEKPLSVPSQLLNSSITANENFVDCGRTSVQSQQFIGQVFSRIVGGRQAIPHSHPWQVLLNDRGRFCGGKICLEDELNTCQIHIATVLNVNWIVTAAHCVNGTDQNHLLAEFGVHDRYSVENSRITRTIDKIVIYPTYNGKSSRWIHDIALLRLSESLRLNPFIRAICLPGKENFVRLSDRTIVTGWGETQGTGNFRYLREVEVPLQPNDQCGLKEISLETSLCGGLCLNGTCDACQGDSGGPMIIQYNDRWHLVGLISWGFSCSGLGVYTKISYYTDWIQQWISQ